MVHGSDAALGVYGDIHISFYHQESLPMTKFILKGCATTGTMPITQDHGDFQSKLLPAAMSSVVLWDLGSEMVSMVPVATEGHAEA